MPAATGSGLAIVVPARGAAFGDLFNDGHIDVVLNNMDSPPTLLRNVVKNSNHWVAFKLVGGPKSPRDAIGAKVFVTTGAVRQRADVFSGGSYASSSDQRLHFGLGGAAKVDKVEIHWPSGLKQEITVPAVDRIYTGYNFYSNVNPTLNPGFGAIDMHQAAAMHNPAGASNCVPLIRYQAPAVTIKASTTDTPRPSACTSTGLRSISPTWASNM